ncbi:MAG: cellulase family glycosylhydrolase [Ruminococcus sp.]|nr:cellulase family glycosylhydrolase [Ruminococcus sp.]
MNRLKNARRYLALFTALVMAFSLSACGGSKESGDIAGNDTVDNAEVTENTADGQATETDGEEGVLGDWTSSFSAEEYDSMRVKVDGTKFTVDGKEWWINGVNTPWQNWNDFGGNFEPDFWDSHFEMLHNEGVNASRIWINCAGMSIVRLKSDGTVHTIDEQHWKDLDTLFDLAEKHGIYIMATILSFDHFKDGNSGCENYRTMIQSDEATQDYIDKYLVPFVKRYGSSPMLFSVDLMNEPDWVYENDECGKVGLEHLCNFFAKCAAAVHENSDELVTVGAGMVKYNSDKYEGNYFSDEFFQSLAGENSYLDFYSPHYYFWQNSFLGYPFETTPTDFGLDGTKPAVIGEAAVLSESGRTADQDYENAYNNGWNGVMAWTSNGVDNCGSMDDLKPAVNKMRDMAGDKIFPVSG